MFKHELGREATSMVRKFKGIITARSENLFGCNRYYVEPEVKKDGTVPEGFWFDEDDIKTGKMGVKVSPKDTGGPISQVK